MSTIAWLQFADLRFSTEPSQKFKAKVALDDLLEDVEACLQTYQVSPDFIAIGGNIAAGGQPAEYEQAQAFLDKLLGKAGLEKERLFVVPGNRDTTPGQISQGAKFISDFLKDQSSVNTVLGSSPDRQLMFARFAPYAAFVKEYLGEYLAFDPDRYFYVRELRLGGKQVAVLGLNSAWLSGPGEDEDRKVLVGERQVREALAQAEGADLRIAIMHHPLDRLQAFDRDSVEAMLGHNCDFILHGERDHVQLLGEPDTRALILGVGARERGTGHPDSYKLVQVDLAAGRGHVYMRRYSERRGGFWTQNGESYRDVQDGHHAFLFKMKRPAAWRNRLKSGDEIRGGQYRIAELIGEGGMARVWLAEQPALGERRVAIKEPKFEREEDQALVKGFQQEVLLAFGLEKVPQVVRVHTLEHRKDETPLLVMEYVAGGSLAGLIAQHPEGIAIGQALGIVQQVLQALAGLHELPGRPVHRDVKPSNILLDEERGALLGDFGLAQLPGESEPPQPSATSHPGSSLYKPPEQEEMGEPLTPATDLYAVGSVLFELLTGKHYRQMPPGTRASEVRAGVPEELDRVVAKALAERPRERYQSAREMAQALKGLAGWLPGDRLDERYEIVSKLTTTARCEIYEARELRFARDRVAIKRLMPDDWLRYRGERVGDARERFEREIAILRKLNHTCVVRLLHEGGQAEEGNRYFVTEFADEGSLEDYVKKKPGGKLDPVDALEIGRSLCQGIDAIHSLGMVHRDIKPSNVLLFSERGECLQIRLTDFSISRIPGDWVGREQKLTQVGEGTFIGTPGYAAPEQFRGHFNDRRSDLYSWAVVVVEMLTGQGFGEMLFGEALTPGEAFSKFSIYHMSERDEVPKILASSTDIPPGIRPILEKALKKDLADRYGSAREVLQALEALDPEKMAVGSGQGEDEAWQAAREAFEGLQRGREYLEVSDWQAAKEAFEEGLALVRPLEEGGDLPDDWPTLSQGLQRGHLFATGMGCLAQEAWEDGIEALEALLELEPDHGDGDTERKLDRARVRWAEELLGKRTGSQSNRAVGKDLA